MDTEEVVSVVEATKIGAAINQWLALILGGIR